MLSPASQNVPSASLLYQTLCLCAFDSRPRASNSPRPFTFTFPKLRHNSQELRGGANSARPRGTKRNWDTSFPSAALGKAPAEPHPAAIGRWREKGVLSASADTASLRLACVTTGSEAPLVQCAERPMSLRSAPHPAPLMTFPFPETHWASSLSRTILPRIKPLPCVPSPRPWWTLVAVVDKSSLPIPRALYPPPRAPALLVQRSCLVHLQAWREVLVNLPHVS